MPTAAQNESIGSFKTEIVQKKELGYVLHIPEHKKDKPLIVFLHGSGEKGTDIEKVKIHGPFKYIRTHELDAYILAPQCPEGQVWDTEVLYRLILKIQKENKGIDPNRIYLTGLSLGGWGSWKLAFNHPELFAALVPICGFFDRIDQSEICKVKDIPIRIFHGLMDDVVEVEYAIWPYKKLKECNADVELTIFDDADHDSWTRVYDNPEIYEWMLNQKKQL